MVIPYHSLNLLIPSLPNHVFYFFSVHHIPIYVLQLTISPSSLLSLPQSCLTSRSFPSPFPIPSPVMFSILLSLFSPFCHFPTHALHRSQALPFLLPFSESSSPFLSFSSHYFITSSMLSISLLPFPFLSSRPNHEIHSYLFVVLSFPLVPSQELYPTCLHLRFPSYPQLQSPSHSLLSLCFTPTLTVGPTSLLLFPFSHHCRKPRSPSHSLAFFHLSPNNKLHPASSPHPCRP